MEVMPGIRGRKGLFYMFIAIFFVSGVLLFFFMQNSYDLRDRQEVTSARILTMNDFINDLNNDMGKATYIASYRSLIAMEEYISLQGEYLDDAEGVFVEAFYNGTILGQNKTILNASSFSDYLARVNQTAGDIGLVLDIEVFDIELYHISPWKLSVNVTFTTNLTDTGGVASWLYNVEQQTEVPVIDLRDPMYSVGTLGRVPNTIRRTNFTFFINDTNDANDTTNLIAHADAGYYVATEMAPTYLMRMEGDFSNSSNGIESLISVPRLETQDLTVDSSKSLADHFYFSNKSANSTICGTLINTPSWFKIDQGRLELYEIDPKLNPDGYIC